MLTVAQLRLRVESDLGDEALAGLLAAAYEAIDDYAGTAGGVAEFLQAGASDLLLLSRRARAITSVSERGRVLDPTDYTLRPGGYQLQRLHTGLSPASHWHGRVDVSYDPYVDEASRDRVAAGLISADLAFHPGLASQTLGDWSESYQSASPDSDVATQRQAILASLWVADGILAR